MEGDVMFIKTKVINTNEIEKFLNYVNSDVNYEDYCKKTIAEGKEPADIRRYKLLYIAIPMHVFNYDELIYIKAKIDVIEDEESKVVVAAVIKHAEEELKQLTEAYNSGNLETFLLNNKINCRSYISRLGQDTIYRKNEVERTQLTEAGEKVVELATKIDLELLDEIERSANELRHQFASSEKKR